MGYIKLEISSGFAVAKLNSASLEINTWKYSDLESRIQEWIIFFMDKKYPLIYDNEWSD